MSRAGKRILAGLQEALAHSRGERTGCIVHIPREVDGTIILERQMTTQDLFDTMVTHIATMPHQANLAAGETCLYRIPGGKSCPVGAVMTDAEVDQRNSRGMSTRTYRGDVRSLAIEGLLPDRLKEHLTLLAVVQLTHDDDRNWHPDRTSGPIARFMRHELGLVADAFGLDTKHLDAAFGTASERPRMAGEETDGE